jgi:large subunit ribosomal protein L17
MRHKKDFKGLGLSRSKRKALLRNLTKSLFIYERINTTLVRAKQTSRFAERLISLAKKDTLSSRRLIYSYINDRDLVTRIFNEIAPRFKQRQGGYTRIIRAGMRKGDNAQMVILELSELKPKEPARPKKEKEKAREESGLGAQPIEKATESAEEKPKKPEEKPQEKMRPVQKKKPPKKFLGSLRRFFKKERDSL